VKLAKLIEKEFQEAVRLLLKQPLPLWAAFKMRGIIKKIDVELDNYEEVRRGALMKYGKKKEDGTLSMNEVGNIQFEQEDFRAFVKEMGELTAIEVELGTISLAELGDDIKLSTSDLMSLDDLLVD
jgi:hypothetical protein